MLRLLRSPYTSSTPELTLDGNTIKAATIADTGVLERAALFLLGGGEDGDSLGGVRGDCVYTFTVMFFGI